MRQKSPSPIDAWAKAARPTVSRPSWFTQHPKALADVRRFAELRERGETRASWSQFAQWMKATHNCPVRWEQIRKIGMGEAHTNG